MKRGLLALLFVLGLIESAAAYEPMRRKVYMFGFGASFTDSVAYITDVQAIDSAYIHPNGFLADRTLYGVQLDVYLQTVLNKKNMTCVVFFDKSKSKVEKKYLKIKKKYLKDHAVVLTPIGRDEFKFKREEWIDPTVAENPAQTQPQGEQKLEEGSQASGKGGPKGAPNGKKGKGGPAPR